MNYPDQFTFITDEVSQDPAVVEQFLRDYQLPGFELRSMFGKAFAELTREDVAAVKAMAIDGGWKVVGCATPVFKCAIDDPGAIAVHVDYFKRALETAHELGADLVRVFTFLRQTGTRDAAMVERVASHIRTLAGLAEGSGVRVGIENEHSCVIATIPELESLFARLPEAAIGIIWDPCNILYVPEYKEAPAEGYGAVASRVIHVHVKDATRRVPQDAQLSATASIVGQGDVGWAGHVKTLAESGYRGFLSLETHWRSEQLAEETLHLPAGYAFSQGGDPASRRCMDELRALCARVG